MRAVHLTRRGPDGGTLTTVDADVPAPREDEVLVRVEACGLCGHDQADRYGLTRGAPPDPLVLGHEIAGTVEALGPAARGLAVGQRVASKQFATCGRCRWCRSGEELRCPDRAFVYGGLADDVLVRSSALLPVPDEVSSPVAAVVACAVGTALQACRAVGVRAGESVLVTGAGGGLGLHGVQVAAALGARVTGLTGSPEKAETVLAAGADRVLHTADVVGRRSSPGPAVDVVLDTVGAPETFTALLRGLVHGGRLVLVGQQTGRPVSFHPFHLLSRELVVTGSESTSAATFAEALRWVASGTVVPVVRPYPMDMVAEAFADMDRRAVAGRAVVVP
ncbi:alcohol dehydrogenase catalytic domain-containing protein [Actinomycetospora straminea]|uniref:alcohol dehydrogenase n=1 Tax=Actinomycetospora straminea TaxID=663607 RepID=A0ABP9EJW9_9PSEU|nr:alcohol dehydrogenase catalytic domain-containing protein [Actinomycetospora straminea]MDD7933790.1 alcohol dehydrogenase catalytic domain-containing protein [Actinomycetospora straminea]